MKRQGTMTRLPHLVIAGVVASGLLSACGSSSHPPKNIVHRKSAASKAGETHWVATVRGNSSAPSGRWQIELEPKTHLVYLRTPANRPFATGQLMSGGRMKFAVLRNCAGQGKPATGLYSYQESSNQLKISKQSDSCGERSTILTGQAWSRQ
jgi:hypothetical protein